MKNGVRISDTLYLNCLCAEHLEDSTCEVYLRNSQQWEKLDIQLRVQLTKLSAYLTATET